MQWRERAQDSEWGGERKRDGEKRKGVQREERKRARELGEGQREEGGWAGKDSETSKGARGRQERAGVGVQASERDTEGRERGEAGLVQGAREGRERKETDHREGGRGENRGGVAQC